MLFILFSCYIPDEGFFGGKRRVHNMAKISKNKKMQFQIVGVRYMPKYIVNQNISLILKQCILKLQNLWHCIFDIANNLSIN